MKCGKVNGIRVEINLGVILFYVLAVTVWAAESEYCRPLLLRHLAKIQTAMLQTLLEFPYGKWVTSISSQKQQAQAIGSLRGQDN